jgi:two-component system response regulator HydG
MKRMDDKLRILVVDDDHSMARTLTDILRVKGYAAEAAHSGSEALERVVEVSFDCVLSDIKMPEINGVELYRAIKARQPHLPVVFMSAYSSDSLVREGLEEGAIAVLTKPLDIGLLLSFCSFLRKERSVVIVDDDPGFVRTLGDILRLRGFAVTQITDPHEVMEGLGESEGIVLLDMKLNGFSGLEILQRIREQHPQLPVILVTGYRVQMASAIETALEVGAYACLYKPLEIDKLVELLTEVQRQKLASVLRA